MVCKHCGKAIEPTNPMCPACGTVNPLSGGNGFWDIVENGETESANNPPAPPAPPVDPAREQNLIDRANRLTERLKNVRTIAIAGILAFLIAALIGIVSIVALFGRLSDSRDRYNALANSSAGLRNEIEDLEEENAELRGRLESRPTTTLGQTSVPSLSFLHQPTDETVMIGNTGTCIFECRVAGTVKEFFWQKKEGDDWVTLTFDHQRGSLNCNSEYGLELREVFSGECSARIYAFDLKSAAYGTYRVIAVTDGFALFSDEVELKKPDSVPGAWFAGNNLPAAAASTPVPSDPPATTETPASEPAFTPTPLNEDWREQVVS